MKVFEILTVFIIISISYIVRICAKTVQLTVHGTPICRHKYSPPEKISNENVTAKLKHNKFSAPLKSKSLPCDKKITLSANVQYSNIRDKAFYVTYTYSNSSTNFTEIIPTDCKKDNVYNGPNYICDFGELNPNKYERERKQEYEDILDNMESGAGLG
uniref:Uncharacterized protein n=1 Tax=Strongyloides papillosus TaxID=174720 RepID=A0A0N5BL43_STREA